MKRRIVIVLLLLCLCISLMPIKADAATHGSCGQGVYYDYYESAQMLYIYGSGAIYDNMYMDSYSNYAPWGSYCGKIKQVVIEYGVTGIGKGAFLNCTNLESISIPASVTRIGQRAFERCFALKNVSLPASLTTLEPYAFYKSGIEKVTLPYGITTISMYAFAECDNLESVTVQGDVAEIGANAFYSTGLKEFVVNGSLSGKIDERAFAYCKQLTSFRIPGTVKQIMSSAFANCSSLTELVLEEGITDIWSSAFSGTGVTSITIPSTVTFINGAIFSSSGALKNITVYAEAVENWTESIASSTNMEYARIIGNAPETDVHIFGSTAKENPDFVVYYDEGTTGWEEPIWNDYIIEKWGQPWSSKSGTCTDTISWELTTDGMLTVSGTGPLPDFATGEAPWYIFRDRIEKVVIEDGITTVGTYSFMELGKMTCAEIAGSVERIGGNAFYKCYLLDTLVLNEGLKQIDRQAFQNCNNLTVVDLPDTVTTLANGSFYDCGIETAYMPQMLTELPYKPFANCKIKEIYFPGDAPAFGQNCFGGMNATVYYPANNPTWTEEVMQDYGGTITWVPYGEASEPTAKFTTISTSLGGNIAMNFYLELSEDLVADPEAYIQFTYAGKTLNVPLSEGVLSGGVYRFACPITSKNMTDEITAQVYNGNGPVGASKTMDVATYCNWVIANYTDAKTVNLMKAMLNYGASAQLLFNYRTDDLANAALADSDKILGKVDASAYIHSRTGEEEGIKPTTYTLLLDSETTVRVYFQLTGDKTIDEYTFTVDGVEVEPVYKDGLYYIQKTDIGAHQLDELHIFTCGDITIRYGGLSYVNQVMTYYTEGTTFDMASALFAYSKAAEDYIG